MSALAYVKCSRCGVLFTCSGDLDVSARPTVCLICTPKRSAVRRFVSCDAFDSHKSVGLYVGDYFDHAGYLWMCTHRSKRGNVCGSVQLSLY